MDEAPAEPPRQMMKKHNAGWEKNKFTEAYCVSEVSPKNVKGACKLLPRRKQIS